jgi:hypothetical protein
MELFPSIDQNILIFPDDAKNHRKSGRTGSRQDRKARKASCAPGQGGRFANTLRLLK